MQKGIFWIGSETGTNKHQIYHFKKTVNFEKNVGMTVKISADSRYKLYINGKYVAEGPCIGTEQYYDAVDISEFLRAGENEFEAVVLYLGGNSGMSCISRKNKVAFMLDGTLSDGRKFGTDQSWQVALDENVEFYSSYVHPNGFFCEKYIGDTPLEWKNSVEHTWVTYKMNTWGAFGNYFVKEREIPVLYPDSPKKMEITDSGENYVLYDLKNHSVGYPEFVFSGTGKAEITYSEAYMFYVEEKNWYIKQKRDDSSGEIVGSTDILNINSEAYRYRPFLTKTARYIKVKFDSGVKIKEANFLEYRYPLNIVNNFECSDEVYNKIWENSVRTLRNCMFDTYVDCPYYEMEQYTEDTYLEMMYTLMISDDYRIIKKAITDTWQSQNYEGMMLASAPMYYKQITPTFNFFWIMMVEKYLLYSGDIDFVKRLLPSAYSILSWFESYINEDGVVGATDYGRFIDWVAGWKSGFYPDNAEKNPMCIVSLMYLYSIKAVAQMFLKAGKKHIAEELSHQYEVLKKNINKVFFSKEEFMYTDTTKGNFCEHSQIWAVLSGAIEGDDAVKCLENAKKDYVLKCSFSYRFFRFRAYEKCGICMDMDEAMSGWKEMLSQGATTWFENPGHARSDCHGWSSVPIYEFTTRILGIQPISDGFYDILIKPEFLKLDYAKGSIYTKHGKVDISWKKENGKYTIRVISPKEITKHIVLLDGKTTKTNDSNITVEY